MRSVGAPFAGDCVHDADYVIPCGSFSHLYIAISKEGYLVLVYFDDSVNQVVAARVKYKGYSSHTDIFLFPWTEGHLVAQMHHEWVHTVSFDCDGYCLSFRNQLSDFFHQYRFIYSDCLWHTFVQWYDCKNTDNFHYL